MRPLVWIGRALALLVVICAGLWVFGPYESARLVTTFDPARLGDDPSAYFAASEARFDDITPGVEKRIVWADADGTPTGWSVLYIHGFSATSEEIRPVPDNVAKALGANLVYTRLQGHGRGGDAMAQARVAGWADDLAEALAVAQRVGDRVLVIATSTGATLMTGGLQQDVPGARDVAGVVFVSPNFAVNSAAAPLLTFPAARHWVPLVAGQTRSFAPANDGQARYWTTQYPSVALMPMAALVRAVARGEMEGTDVPALFWFSDADQVVDAAATRKMMQDWRSPVRRITPRLGPQDDPFAHVTAGDILSPGQTEPAVRAILDFVKEL
ncbi:alpha/beta hydrolase [Aliishimia ponticola]|uniref:Alpha/beta hydrolase n=1 Tax=Aliishimia ponticola TaxID=2499833 RepID=A0A4S4N961_9RHOB|nr:alpha/beta hydrolase [Aliishimia ponticola]THH35766.1 alpha/beta hydrolase [Aliishimia ponticola]